MRLGSQNIKGSGSAMCDHAFDYMVRGKDCINESCP